MRLTTIILIASLMQVSASTLAQKITLNRQNTSIELVLKDIRQQSGYDIFYDSKLLPSTEKVTVSINNADVKEAMEATLKNTNLSFDIDGKTIAIKKKETRFLDNLTATFAAIDVHGRVVDETGKALPGVTVKVKGSNQATITNPNGEFDLKKIDNDAFIILSFIGYIQKEVPAASDLNNIRMELSNSKLDEVQIIAYGVTSKRLTTGNISSIKSADIERQPVDNPLLSLEGQIPGLLVTQSTGLPGSGVTVRIQGQNSISKGNDPLYVIDGVPYDSQLPPKLTSIQGNSGAGADENFQSRYGNPFSFLNPADIERIDVLKDADATAIYGSRAANGAILITTKKGIAGKTKGELRIENGWGSVTRMLPMLNTSQYLEMRKEAFANSNATPGTYDYDLNGDYDQSRYTDWQKVLIGGTAKQTNLQGSISGGTLNTQFLISGGFNRQTTVFPGNFNDTKGSFHASLTNSSMDNKFKLQFTASYLIDNTELPNADLTSTAVAMAPNAPALYNADGTINWALKSDGSSIWNYPGNPIATLYNKSINKTNNLVSNLGLSYNLAPGLELRSSFGYTHYQNNENVIYPLKGISPPSRPYSGRFAGFGNSNTNSFIIEPQISYSKTLGKGTISGLIGGTLQQQQINYESIYTDGFNSDELMENLTSAAHYYPNTSYASLYKYNAVFGRLNYNWNNRYIISANLRRDGSSRFGSQNQFHNFGSIAGAWVFTEEEFIKNQLHWLSFGKLKASYGTTGNDQIGNYQYLNLYRSVGGIGIPYQGIATIEPAGLPNPYLGWEETKKTELGVDLGFLNDRVLFTVNYFSNTSNNQLMAYSLPIMTGFPSITENFPATVRNYGFEFNITSTNVQGNSFKWTSGFNFTVPHNKLIAFPNLDQSAYANLLVVGQPITLVKVFHFLGVDPATGRYQVQSSNGSPTYSPDDKLDRTVFINTSPKFYGGFSNAFTYKRIQLDVLLQFAKQKGRDYSLGNYPGNSNTNQPIYVLDRWQKAGDVKKIQQFTTYNDDSYIQAMSAANSSDAVYGDASYLRIKNISLTWALPEHWSKSLGMNSLQVYALAQNAFIVTNYKGLDPENMGLNSLPPLKVFSLGIKAGL